MREIEFHENDKCYFCGRKPEDFRKLQDKIGKEFDREINKAREEFKQVNSKFQTENQEVIDQLRAVEPKNLDLTIRTIKTDLETFRNMIPNLDNILSHYEKTLKKKEEWRLRDFLAKLESRDREDVNISRSGLRDLKALKDQFEAEKKNIFFEYKIPLKHLRTPGYRDTVYHITVCMICMHMIEQVNAWRDQQT